MRIRIEIDVYEETGLDPEHSSGLSDGGYTLITQALAPYGDDVAIERCDDGQ